MQQKHVLITQYSVFTMDTATPVLCLLQCLTHTNPDDEHKPTISKFGSWDSLLKCFHQNGIITLNRIELAGCCICLFFQTSCALDGVVYYLCLQSSNTTKSLKSLSIEWDKPSDAALDCICKALSFSDYSPPDIVGYGSEMEKCHISGLSDTFWRNWMTIILSLMCFLITESRTLVYS